MIAVDTNIICYLFITMDKKILGSFPDTAMRPKDFIEDRTL